MDRDEYQRLRRQLDEELRAGIEMLQAGHRAKVEALDARWQEPAEQIGPVEADPEPAVADAAAPEPAVQAAPVSAPPDPPSPRRGVPGRSSPTSRRPWRPSGRSLRRRTFSAPCPTRLPAAPFIEQQLTGCYGFELCHGRAPSALQRSYWTCWLSQLSAVVLNAKEKRTAISGLMPRGH